MWKNFEGIENSIKSEYKSEKQKGTKIYKS